MKKVLHGATALATLGCLLQPAFAASDSRPLATAQPDPSPEVAPYFIGETDPRWSSAEWSKQDIEALRQRVKYVFVIFNENRSFDHEYGTFPGVNGLYSDGKNPRSAADTPGFTQVYADNLTGETIKVQPFRVGPEQNSTFKDSTDHSHTGLAAKLDVQNGVPQMDKFAFVEGIATRAPAVPKARRWASSSRASSWRMSTATQSPSSGDTPAASPSSTTSSPLRTRRPRPTPSP
jgi:phospholipase C